MISHAITAFDLSTWECFFSLQNAFARLQSWQSCLVGSRAMLCPSILRWFPFESSKHLGFFFQMFMFLWGAGGLLAGNDVGRCCCKMLVQTSYCTSTGGRLSMVIHSDRDAGVVVSGRKKRSKFLLVDWDWIFFCLPHGNLTDSFPTTTLAKQGEVHGCGFRFENTFHVRPEFWQ